MYLLFASNSRAWLGFLPSFCTAPIKGASVR
ncbi:hypothetical protein SAMN05444747_12916 [Variovorax sp. OV329]|nr:hypothetical protein SAMN05444747_12916 [Variovorax sp. OV329]